MVVVETVSVLDVGLVSWQTQCLFLIWLVVFDASNIASFIRIHNQKESEQVQRVCVEEKLEQILNCTHLYYTHTHTIIETSKFFKALKNN